MDIKEKIKTLLLDGFVETDSIDDLQYDTTLVSSGILDSISIIQLIDVLEKEFNVEFEAHEIDRDQFDSINKIEKIIVGKQK
jgi:acyl carrier protein